MQNEFQKIPKEEENNEKNIKEIISFIHSQFLTGNFIPLILDVDCIQDIIDANLIPKIISFIDYKYDKSIIFEAISTIGFITLGNLEQTQVIIDSGVCKNLIDLLDCNDDVFIEDSISIFDNLAIKTKEFRNYLLNIGIIDGLVYLLKTFEKLTKSIQSNLISLVSHFFSYNNSNEEFKMLLPLTNYFQKLINYSSDFIVIETLEIIYNLTKDSTENIQLIIDLNITNDIICKINSFNASLSLISLKLLQNILLGTNPQFKAIMMFPIFRKIKNSLKRYVPPQEVFKTISIIVKRDNSLVIQAIQLNLEFFLISLNNEVIPFEKDVLKCLILMISVGDINEIFYWVKSIIQYFINTNERREVEILILYLRGIETICLKVSELKHKEIIYQKLTLRGHQMIKDLQNHSNDRLREKAYQVSKIAFQMKKPKLCPKLYDIYISFKDEYIK